MDFDNTQDFSGQNEPQQPQQPQSPPSQPAQPQPPMTPNIPDFSSAVYEPVGKKKGSGWKVFWGIVITLSILANGFMLLLIIGMGVALGSSGISSHKQDGIVESVLVDGPRDNKIAVINIEGVIESEMSAWVHKQVEHAEADENVKALIVRIVSPGGAVSSSDQIHYYISRFKANTNKPVLAFMQSIAASGGYYSAVACDEIMAEPTVITGSIGVIMNHLVIKDLLEEKLGINPVTIKSGPRKDWPSMFNETTDEEKQYLMERVITPAYDRFVELVAEGRSEVLTEDEIRELADGSIYTADQALENKLIDSIGYFEQAVGKAEQMAGVSGTRVVSYEEEFSLFTFMGAESRNKINIDAEILEKLAAPRILYLWDGKN